MCKISSQSDEWCQKWRGVLSLTHTPPPSPIMLCVTFLGLCLLGLKLGDDFFENLVLLDPGKLNFHLIGETSFSFMTMMTMSHVQFDTLSSLRFLLFSALSPGMGGGVLQKKRIGMTIRNPRKLP